MTPLGAQQPLVSPPDSVSSTLHSHVARLGLAGVSASESLRDTGWQASWGLPQPAAAGWAVATSPWDARHGGVAVLARLGTPLHGGPRGTRELRKRPFGGIWVPDARSHWSCRTWCFRSSRSAWRHRVPARGRGRRAAEAAGVSALRLPMSLRWAGLSAPGHVAPGHGVLGWGSRACRAARRCCGC